MNGNGAYWAGIDVHFAQPGPLNDPRTFCEPSPMKAIPMASRKGTVAQVEEVEVSLRSIDLPFPNFSIGCVSSANINPFATEA
jgi:hypothetical protein